MTNPSSLDSQAERDRRRRMRQHTPDHWFWLVIALGSLAVDFVFALFL